MHNQNQPHRLVYQNAYESFVPSRFITLRTDRVTADCQNCQSLAPNDYTIYVHVIYVMLMIIQRLYK